MEGCCWWYRGEGVARCFKPKSIKKKPWCPLRPMPEWKQGLEVKGFIPSAKSMKTNFQDLIPTMTTKESSDNATQTIEEGVNRN